MLDRDLLRTCQTVTDAALQAVFEGKVEEAKQALEENPNVIFARTRDWYNAWHLAARAGNMEVSCARMGS